VSRSWIAAVVLAMGVVTFFSPPPFCLWNGVHGEGTARALTPTFPSLDLSSCKPWQE
jgi:hypothetical protein